MAFSYIIGSGGVDTDKSYPYEGQVCASVHVDFIFSLLFFFVVCETARHMQIQLQDYWSKNESLHPNNSWWWEKPTGSSSIPWTSISSCGCQSEYIQGKVTQDQWTCVEWSSLTVLQRGSFECTLLLKMESVSSSGCHRIRYKEQKGLLAGQKQASEHKNDYKQS